MADRTSPRTFDELVAEAVAVPVDGWDFSWFDGRATEARPPWGYARAMGERVARATAVLDVQTGGGETFARALEPLAAVPDRPATAVATEGWPPNAVRAAALLRPLGATVVAAADAPTLPFADGAFDLVVSRHPVTVWWAEIARVLRPGGTYFSQEVGPASVFELVEFFRGPRSPEERSGRDPERAARAARAAGLDVVDLRTAALRTEFHDIGAVVHFLRKVVWMVPDFTVERYHDRLAELHRRIEAEGPFVATTTRFLIEAVKPAGPATPAAPRGPDRPTGPVPLVPYHS
ncbi:class I SAM-dependent methyltransferase [Streptomyces paludis]|uniref:Class I SAM-dependent methyltransferase n=1 Tax=Streptomyces paludis TaxID=2282738 RepID=A0A345HTK4_9ACTN|nr:class I SAM-dependent methyltransferase [Streptomyces paludis]AXG80028.1 class I SAM-dependent methyltransferase [Streptomyces paludis]